MTFSKPFGGGVAPGTYALGLAFVGSGLALLFSLVSALGVLPAGERREREIPLSLASVSAGTSPLRVSAQEVVVQVDARGTIHLGGREVGLEVLEARLAKLKSEAGETALAVRADTRAPHGVVARILAAARTVGVRDASIITIAPPTAHE